jgi:hypothetical protein
MPCDTLVTVANVSDLCACADARAVNGGSSESSPRPRCGARAHVKTAEHLHDAHVEGALVQRQMRQVRRGLRQPRAAGRSSSPHPARAASQPAASARLASSSGTSGCRSCAGSFLSSEDADESVGRMELRTSAVPMALSET